MASKFFVVYERRESDRYADGRPRKVVRQLVSMFDEKDEARAFAKAKKGVVWIADKKQYVR